MNQRKIKSCMPKLITDGGIFKNMPLYGNATAREMGVIYSLQHSGNKEASSLVTELCGDDGKITEENEIFLGQLLTSVYKSNWDAMYLALTAEYNPIENYSMTESGRDVTTGTNNETRVIGERVEHDDYGPTKQTNSYGATSDEMTYGNTSTTDVYGALSESNSYGSKTTTHTNGEIVETTLVGNQQRTNEDKIAAFNSTDYQKSNQSIQNDNAHTDSKTTGQHSDSDLEGEHTDTHTSQAHTDMHSGASHTDSQSSSEHTDTIETISKIDTHMQEEATDTVNGANNSATDHNFTRKGNVGVTTSQQMIQSELDLRSFDFYARIFKDIDRYLALSVY